MFGVMLFLKIMQRLIQESFWKKNVLLKLYYILIIWYYPYKTSKVTFENLRIIRGQSVKKTLGERGMIQKYYSNEWFIKYHAELNHICIYSRIYGGTSIELVLGRGSFPVMWLLNQVVSRSIINNKKWFLTNSRSK